MYAAFFFANMGNYKSFGDTKVVPSLSKVHYVVTQEDMFLL